MTYVIRWRAGENYIAQMKGAIIYDSKSGATAQYAQWLSLALRLPALESGRTDWLQLNKYDWLVIGAPVYNGRLLIQDWLQCHEKCLRTKKLFLFIVSITPESEAARRMQVIHDNLPVDIIAGEHIYWLPGRHPEPEKAEEPDPLSPFHLNPLCDAVSCWSVGIPVPDNH